MHPSSAPVHGAPLPRWLWAAFGCTVLVLQLLILARDREILEKVCGGDDGFVRQQRVIHTTMVGRDVAVGPLNGLTASSAPLEFKPGYMPQQQQGAGAAPSSIVAGRGSNSAMRGEEQQWSEAGLGAEEEENASSSSQQWGASVKVCLLCCIPLRESLSAHQHAPRTADAELCYQLLLVNCPYGVI